MANDEEVIELTDEVKFSRLDLILKELKNMSRLLGSINQNMNKQLEPMKADIEMCKVSLGKIRKFGPPSESPISTPAAPSSYVPPEF